MTRCAATTRAGAPCKGVAIGSSRGQNSGPWCPAHHPEYADARRRRASKGGKRGGRGRPLLQVQAVADQLQELAEKVLAGDLDRGAAAVCGQLLNYKIRALDVARAWRETEELAREVEELREVLERNKAYGA